MAQTELFILMPSVKAHNIPAIAPSILQCEGHAFALRWCVLQQGSEADEKGFKKLNQALDWVPLSAWFHTPSDDSIHYPNLYRRTGEIIAAHPECKAIVFSEDRGQKDGNRILRAHPDNMKPGFVDGSQCLWNRAFVGDKRYDWDARKQEADGFFAMELYQKEPTAFIFCDEVLVRFNSLEQ
jgi:hypothetical protein